MAVELPLEMSPQQLKSLQETGEKVALIDVREPEEFAVASLPDSRLIPMQTIPGHVETIRALASENPVAILCHHGVRSLNVAMWLRGQGVGNCFSIAGGIDRWSYEVDPDIPRY